LEFRATVWFWRGPAPWYFVTVPEPEAAQLADASRLVTYGWGMIPVTAQVGRTSWTTSLFPKDGTYVVPLKALVRRAERIDDGDEVLVVLSVAV
jgi:hypothetical protein